MVQNILSFGNFKGKSFEYILFNAPWYFHWMHEEQILQTRNDYSTEDRDYFDELYRRADGLVGVCAKCQERHFTRIDISDLVGSASNGHAGLFCDECYDPDVEIQFALRPSFFSVSRRVPRAAQKAITRSIKDHFLGPDGNLTQKRMQDFFRTDEFFINATPGFFNSTGEEVAE